MAKKKKYEDDKDQDQDLDLIEEQAILDMQKKLGEIQHLVAGAALPMKSLIAGKIKKLDDEGVDALAGAIVSSMIVSTFSSVTLELLESWANKHAK